MLNLVYKIDIYTHYSWIPISRTFADFSFSYWFFVWLVIDKIDKPMQASVLKTFN